MITEGRVNKTRFAILSGMVLFLSLALAVTNSWAAGVRIVPSSAHVEPGESFSVDVIAEGIPSEGLGSVQFRLNIVADGAEVTGVNDLAQAISTDVSVSAPLLISSPTATRSGLGDMFLGGQGANGILVLDNESLDNNTALYTYAHTKGAVRSEGSGSVARFMFKVGEQVEAEQIVIFVTDVLLLDGGPAYPLDYNEEGVVTLRCTAQMPSLLGLSPAVATQVLAENGLVLGDLYEIDNPDNSLALDVVLAQTLTPGEQVDCGSSVNLAVNVAPDEVAMAEAVDVSGDDSGSVIVNWTPSTAGDTAGYRIYLGTDLLAEITGPTATSRQIDGLPVGVEQLLRLSAYDTFGNESSGVTITALAIDDVAPIVSFGAIEDGKIYNIAVTPQIAVSDASPDNLSLTLNGGYYSPGTPIGGEDDYSLTAIATDANGNTTTQSVSFTIDLTAPLIVPQDLADNGFYSSGIAPSFAIDDLHLDASSTTYLLNGQSYLPGTVIAQEGAYSLGVTAADLAGNTSTLTINFAIDLTAPVSMAGAGEPQFSADGTTYITSRTSITLSSSDPGSVVSGVADLEYRLDGGSWQNYSEPFTLEGVSEGIHLLDYRSTDSAGNQEAARSQELVIDDSAPVTAIAAGSPQSVGADGTLYVGGATEFVLSATDDSSGPASTEYRIDGGSWVAYAPFTLAGLADGAHTIAFRSVDNLGNLEIEQSLAVVVDNSAPATAISFGDPKYVDEQGRLFATGATGVSLTSEGDLSGIALIEYRLDGGAWKTYSSFDLQGLADGAHLIGFRSTDNLGNVETEQHFTVVVDNAAPVTSITAGEPHHTAADGTVYVSTGTEFTVNAEDGDSGVASTEYRLDGGAWISYEPFSLAGLADGVHTIGYRSTDKLGHLEDEGSLTVMVDDSAPETTIATGTPRFIGPDGDSYVGGTTVFTLSATDSSSGVAVSEYRLDNGSWTPYAPFTLTGLTDGTHTIGYRSVDNLGNLETERSLVVVADNTAPVSAIDIAVPKYNGQDGTLFVAEATGFTLSAEDALSGVASIEYRLDGGDWSAYSPFDLEGLAEGTHLIGFRSTDSLGNVEVEQQLSVVVDNTAPLTTVTTGDPHYTGADGTLFVGTATGMSLAAEDEYSGVASTEYRIDGGEWTLYAPFALSGLADGSHTVEYRSTDNLGNLEEIRGITVTIDDTASESAISAGDPQHTGADGTLYVGGATGFVIEAVDNLAGIASIEYKIDTGAWAGYAPFTLAGLADGGHTVNYRSTDQLGNREEERSLAVVVDNSIPQTKIAVGTPQLVDQNGTLYVGGATGFTLSASDNLSGIASVEYRIDGGDWTAYLTFTLNGVIDGNHEIGYRASDNLGNVEPEQTLKVVVDNSVPETAISVGEPRYTDGDNVLFVGASTQFSLSSTDEFSGVASTEYRIDSGDWTTYAPFTMAETADGDHLLGYRSVDRLGNMEEQKDLAVTVDKKAPVSRIEFGSLAYQAEGRTFVSIATGLEVVSNDALSGVKASYYRIDEAVEWQLFEGGFTLENLEFGDHVIQFYGIDNVDNAESVKSLVFTVLGVDVSTRLLNLPRVLVWTDDPDDLHGKNRVSYDYDDLQTFFQKAFGVPDVYLGFVTDADAFRSELRSGIYNMVMVIDQDTPFDAVFMREMREAVNNGMGLLLSSWGNNVHPIWQDLFGVDFSGSLAMDEAVREIHLFESPVSWEQTLSAEGRVLRTVVDKGQLAGTVGGQAVPAVVLGEYGQGRTAFFSYNIIESALGGELAEHAAVLRNAASYLLPREVGPDAGGIALFETTINLQGTGMTVRATENLGDGLVYLPLFDHQDEKLEYEFSFTDGDEASYRYFAAIPDLAGEYIKDTAVELYLDGDYVPYQVYRDTFIVEPDSAGMIAQAISLLEGYGGEYPDAADELAVLADRLAGIRDMPRTTSKECDQLIHQLVQVVAQLEKLPFDSSELRMLLDDYLRIVEGDAALL